MRKHLYVKTLVVVMVLGLCSVVHALPCSSGFVSGGADPYVCQNGTPGAQNDWNTDINDGAGFFGFTDWAPLEKNDTPGDVEAGIFNIGLTVSPDANVPVGTWAFTNSPWDDFTDIMLVLKDGRLDMPPPGNDENDTWFSAYFVSPGDLSGLWDTGGPGLSHMSVYGRGTPGDDFPEPVPEPGTVLLLGSGMLGLAVYRKNSKK